MFLTGEHSNFFKIVLGDNIRLYTQAVTLEMLYFQAEVDIREKKSQVVQTCFRALTERFAPEFCNHIKGYLDHYHLVVATPPLSPSTSVIAISPSPTPLLKQLELAYPPSLTPAPERPPSVKRQWPYSPPLPDALVMQGVKFCCICQTHDHDGYSCPSFRCDSCQQDAPGYPRRCCPMNPSIRYQ
jgi:hypothetical protein